MYSTWHCLQSMLSLAGWFAETYVSPMCNMDLFTEQEMICANVLPCGHPACRVEMDPCLRGSDKWDHRPMIGCLWKVFRSTGRPNWMKSQNLRNPNFIDQQKLFSFFIDQQNLCFIFYWSTKMWFWKIRILLINKIDSRFLLINKIWSSFFIDQQNFENYHTYS